MAGRPSKRLEVGALEAGDLEQIVKRPRRTLACAACRPSQQLFETTRAYPGHVEHVVRYLLEGGKAEDTKVSLPDLIAARLSMLAQSTRDVLQAAAVLGIEPQQRPASLDDAERRRSSPRSPTPRCTACSGSDPSGELDVHEPPRARNRLRRDAGRRSPLAPRERRRRGRRRCRTTSVCSVITTISPVTRSEAIQLLRAAGDHAAEQLDETGAGQFFYRALVAVRQAVQSGDIEDGADHQFVSLSVRLADVLRTRGETALARGILAEARDWSSAPLLVVDDRSRERGDRTVAKATSKARSPRCAAASVARSARAT